MAKAALWAVPDAECAKARGAIRIGLRVVLALNDGHWPRGKPSSVVRRAWSVKVNYG